MLELTTHTDKALDLRETPFEQALKRQLQKKEPYRSNQSTPHAFASEATYCSRRIGLRVMRSGGDVREDSVQFLLSGKVGMFLHEYAQQAYKAAYPDFVSEHKWTLGKVSGRADGIRRHSDGSTVVLEIKSMGEWAIKRAIKQKSPSNDHVTQAGISAVALQAEHVHIVYINRAMALADPVILEWEGLADLDFAQVEIERMSTIVDMVTDSKPVIPARWWEGEEIDNPDAQKFPCGYCPFRNLCVVVGSGEVAADRVDPKLLSSVLAPTAIIPPGQKSPRGKDGNEKVRAYVKR